MANIRGIPWLRILAEGAAIVVSILLAFSIDAWWTDRNEIARERRILTALLVELEQNHELLQEARSRYERSYLDSLELLDHINAGATDIETSELSQIIQGVLVTQTFHLESGTYGALRASGELDLIRDDALRIRLAAWPSHVAEWSEEQLAVFEFVRDVINPFLTDTIRMREIGATFASFPDGEAPPVVPKVTVDVELVNVLITSIKFENLVYQRAQSLWFAIRDGETLKSEIDRIETQTRDYLDE